MSNSQTRGRASAESHGAAISRVVALSPQRQMILEALDEILASQAFASSPRAQLFLRYVVEHGLSGEVDQLKERVIGSTLFGRPPDYDTGADSIVRVTAAEVRKRLSQYNEQGGGERAVVVELPTGSYIPEIHIGTQDHHATPDAPLAQVQPQSRWFAAAVAGWTVAALIGLLWATLTWLVPHPAERPLHRLPWTALFAHNSAPQLIVADSGLGNLRFIYWFPLSLSIYANRSFLNEPPGLNPDDHFVWEQTAPKAHTSAVDARLAASYAALATVAKSTPVIRFARDVQISDFHLNQNFILLGSSSANPWVELFDDQLDFHYHLDRTRGVTITVKNPRPGDPQTLQSPISSGKTGQAYATLALVRGLDGQSSVLIAQGSTMEGTEVAGTLALTRTEELAGILRRCGLDPASPTGTFEILLRLDAAAGSALKSSVLATRCSDTH